MYLFSDSNCAKRKESGLLEAIEAYEMVGVENPLSGSWTKYKRWVAVPGRSGCGGAPLCVRQGNGCCAIPVRWNARRSWT